jgi:mannose/fructose/N-acetylgalactosamine-specific phosphotransferase system component IID
MKKILVLIAAIAALSSCVEHKRNTSSVINKSSLKRVKANLMARVGDRIIVSRITSIIEVDTMYQVNDTLLHNNSMYVIVK